MPAPSAQSSATRRLAACPPAPSRAPCIVPLVRRPRAPLAGLRQPPELCRTRGAIRSSRSDSTARTSTLSRRSSGALRGAVYREPNRRERILQLVRTWRAVSRTAARARLPGLVSARARARAPSCASACAGPELRRALSRRAPQEGVAAADALGPVDQLAERPTKIPLKWSAYPRRHQPKNTTRSRRRSVATAGARRVTKLSCRARNAVSFKRPAVSLESHRSGRIERGAAAAAMGLLPDAAILSRAAVAPTSGGPTNVAAHATVRSTDGTRAKPAERRRGGRGTRTVSLTKLQNARRPSTRA